MSESTFITSIIIVPGISAALLLVLFPYLYRQSRKVYFRIWQVAWGCSVLSYFFQGVYQTDLLTGCAILPFSKLLFYTVPYLIYLSIDVTHEPHLRWRARHFIVAAVLLAWTAWSVPFALHGQPTFAVFMGRSIPASPDIAAFLLLAVAAWHFLTVGRERRSTGYRLLSASVLFWGLLLLSRQFHYLMEVVFANSGHFLGPLPQMLIGVSMMMVLYENDRRNVQQNLLAFSYLGVDFSRVLSLGELAPSMHKLLDRLTRLARTDRALLYILDPFRAVLPSAEVGFGEGFLQALATEVGSSMASVLKIKSADSHSQLQNVPVSVLRSQADAHLVRLGELLAEGGATELTALAIETPDRELAGLLLPPRNDLSFSGSQRGLLISLAMQMGGTLEKNALLHEAQRRAKGFETRTEIGQAVSSRLKQNEVLDAVYKELGRLMDTSVFYIAFLDDEQLRFELEWESGVRQPKRSRTLTNGFSEHMLRTGQPLLIAADLEVMREKLGAVVITRPAKCFCGAPIIIGNKPVGVMAALHYEKENVFNERDLEILEIAARQVAVAVENARLFAQEQRRARYLAFLNNISKSAISSQNADKMLAEIVSEIQQNFQFEHIGVGIVNFNTKEIEIKAEAGTTAHALGKRIPLGVGIMGRVARTNEMVLEQGTGDSLLGLFPESRSVLCIPITYSESLLGVLNVESSRNSAFQQEEILILRTLADLLATALHNVYVFQKLEQQSITDPLTGIKTRRFFNEALQSEWKRALRSGRPFSVVLIDLDKFKEANDSMGHLEGDLVLARIGRLLDSKVRQSNVVARYGGDEFVILMPETGVEQAQILSERLRLWIGTDPILNERHVTGSFGVATFPIHGSAAEDIVRIADSGMYISKPAGGNKASNVEASSDLTKNTEQQRILATPPK